MSNDINVKEFTKKDVFFNNGLVNLKMYLDNCNIQDIVCELTTTKLIFKYPANMEEKYYDEIFKGFIKDNDIVFHTENNRLYWDKDNSYFVYDKKYDVKGKSSANDVKNLYNYITPKDIGISTEEFYNMYLEFAHKNKLKEKSISEDTKSFRKDNSFKKESECKIPILMTKCEAIKSYIDYSVKGNILKFDSKIHQFEDGGFCFKDMINNKDSVINKWEALIYWYGVRIRRYYNSTYFIYLNSLDLLALYEFKKYLKISDEPIQVKDKKTEIIKSIPTNINLFSQLIFDGIKNENFYISNSSKEFQLKFIMYTASKIRHIEDLYKNENEERIKKRKEKLYKNLEKISFVTYTEDGDMKASLEEYTKMYKMIIFINKLMESDYQDASMFKYLAQLITAVSMSKEEKEKINLNMLKLADRMLKFSELRKVYYDVSFKILKKDKGILGTELYKFENMYLKEIGRGDFIMNLHAKSKEVGSSIGLFAANLEDRDLLFKLRNVKNHRQMITYFKDLKFTILKRESEAKFSKEFNDIMEELLILMEEKPENWEVIRDYISIYAIDKYRSTMYAKNINKGGK